MLLVLEPEDFSAAPLLHRPLLLSPSSQAPGWLLLPAQAGRVPRALVGMVLLLACFLLLPDFMLLLSVGMLLLLPA